MNYELLENKLDDFDRNVRLKTLRILREKVDNGEIKETKKTNFVNLHCHTFFSFNAYGYSPEHIVWRAFKEGLETVGIIDFDVLDGVEEMLEAGRILGIKTVVGLETRVFIKEYADKVITSPKEPGIYYMMGLGFYKKPECGSKAEDVLKKMKEVAQSRNLKIIEKINDHLESIKVDYEKDVLPFTPHGNPTERHIVAAYEKKIREYFKNEISAIVSFWAEKLKMKKEDISSEPKDLPQLYEMIRSKLMKYGGVGYIEPEPKSFLSFEEVIAMIKETDALPCAGWLDGTNEGERNIKELLEFMLEKGAVLVNIVPDRNWNIKDPEEKKTKVKNLDEVIKVANELNLPMIAGTEMNKYGQRFVDDFTAPELKPYLETFRQGAFFVYGHTQMGRFFNKGFNSNWAKKYLPTPFTEGLGLPDRSERNDFYVKVGKLMQPDYPYMADENIQGLVDDNISPDEIIKRFDNILKEEKIK